MNDKRITLIGAGLAGSLLAIYLARRGFRVDVYERRPDMRREQISAGRSINLALSVRGLHALREVGLFDDIMKIAIPMKGRMIHPVSGDLMLQRYGKDDSEVIYATSRALLNIALLDAAEQCPGVTLHFNQRCAGMEFSSGTLHFHSEAEGTDWSLSSVPVVGTDGSASAIRSDMTRNEGFRISQHELEYGYKELTIPPAAGGTFRMEKNALHIWPRTTFMLIALPNTDGSFTCTFFYPFKGRESFETLDSRERVQSFFAQQFPDAVPFMPTLVDDFFTNPTGSMVTIKCEPWHIGGKAVLLGDAAHAIVPFFGQGMNCAFEDCTVLNEIIGAETGGRGPETGEAMWAKVFEKFEWKRKVNTNAIADLAVENFVEMRDLVATQQFQLRKKAERLLEERFPDRFVPKYTMVTFRRLPYSVALSRGIIQDRILDAVCAGISDPGDLDVVKADTLVKQELSSLDTHA